MNNMTARAKFFTIILFLTVLLCMLISLSFGEKILHPVQVFRALAAMESKYNNILIRTIRAPRVFVAFFTGAALALAGAITQGIIKNPLASPEILGVVDGGCVGALIFYTLFMDPKNNSLRVSILYLPLFAFIFSIATIFILLMFTRKNPSSFRLILIGIGLSAILKALKGILIVNGPVVFIKEASTWITGTIYGSQGIDAWMIGGWFTFFFAISLLLKRELNLQTLDDDTVVILGSAIPFNRFLLLLFAAALTAGAVAVGGGISFVGLIGPHIARQLVGSRYENLIPVSVLIGGLITLLSDMASKWLFYPMEVPIGIFTALTGAPYFIYLLIQSRKTVRRHTKC